MTFSFTLSDIKPFSVNAMYYGDGRTKSKKYYDWSFSIFDRLNDPQIQAGLAPFRDSFNPETDAYVLRLTAYYPEEVFYRRAGGISARTMDLSNWEKPLVDCLMLPKHHKQPHPYGAPNLNIDDRFVISLSSRKVLAQDNQHSIRIAIKKVKLAQNPRQE